MFNLSIEIEDLRIEAQSNAGNAWIGKIQDVPTGLELEFNTSGEELSCILAQLVHPDGESFDTANAYERVQPFLAKYKMNAKQENIRFRPIP